MANFVAYGQRLSARNVSTLHVVGAYAAGGYSLIHNVPVTQMPFLGTDSEDADGNFGWHSPDFVTGAFGGANGYNAKNGFYGYGMPELVGVQVTSICIVSPSHGQIQKIKSEQLANYVEKTEHRYLKNGHVMIKVYFMEEPLLQLLGTRGQLVICANALLQSGSNLRNNLFKRSIPFMLSLPCALDASGNQVQNPYIDTEAFLYSDPSATVEETGQTVQVVNLGTSNSGGQLIWNSVRTKTNFAGPSTGAQSLARRNVDDETSGTDYSLLGEYYPHFGAIDTITGLLNTVSEVVAFRRPGTTRNAHDLLTPGNVNYQGLGQNTGSGDTFDIREMNMMANLSFNAGGYTKSPWGRRAGLLATGPDFNVPGYQGDNPGKYPAFWGLDKLVNTGILGLQTFAGGLPHIDETADINGLYDAHFNTNLERRNPFFPTYAASYDYYVTFYSLQGSGFSGDGYLPDDVTNSPILAASDFPAYAAEQFRVSIANNINVTNTINTGNASAWLAPVAVDFVADGRLGWQDYIDNAFHAGSFPFTTGSSNIVTALTPVDENNIPFMTEENVRFSGLVQPGTLRDKHMLSLTTGLSIATAEGANSYENAEPGAAISKDLSLAKLFKYTVFVHADAPQARVSRSTYDTPFIDDELDGVTDSSGNTYTYSDFTADSSDLNHMVFHQVLKQSAAGSETDVIGYETFDWGSSTITTNKCADRNAITEIYDDEGQATYKLANTNQCVDANYDRCGCNSVVEDYAPGELTNLSFFEADARRFETVITCPRAITTDFTDPVGTGPSGAFPSVLYVNSYFSTIDTSTDIDSDYAGAYMAGGSTTPGDNKYITGSGGNTYTHRLIEDLGLSAYTGPIYNDVFNNKRNDTNTFQYLYMPGREPFEQDSGLAYFIHEGADFAKIFATIGGAGSDTFNDSDDLENRHMLLFQASTVEGSPTDPRRAHSDLSFDQRWEDLPVEASYISLDAPSECDSANKDQPVRRVRKFVTIGYVRSEGLEEDGTGDEGDQHDEYGCTDVSAVNYNPLATIDDGSCISCDDDITAGGNPTTNPPDAFHYLPYLFQGAQVHDTNTIIQGATDTATTAAIPVDGVLTPTAEVSIDVASTASATYDWWDGNVVNAFNTRGVNEATGLGALNSGSGGAGNSARTFFRMDQFKILANMSTLQAAANAASSDQYAGTFDYAQDFIDAWQLIEDQADPSAMTLTVYDYHIWETNLVNAGHIPNADQGNNGWAVDSYGGTLATPKTNVYSDTIGNYSGIHLDGVTPVAAFGNAAQASGTGSSVFKWSFSSYDTATGGQVEDQGIRAGKQYVAVIRFTPKNACTNTNRAYYWAYNFFVEYCTCTLEGNAFEGIANPTGLNSYPFQETNWAGYSTFPGVNSPNDGVNNLFVSGAPGALPNNFCSGFTDAFGEDSGGLVNGRICLDDIDDPDQEVDCTGFVSWCLSDIRTDCIQDPDNAPYGVYGSLSFNVLIDGFFTQSEVDTFQLYNFPNTEQEFVYQITVTLNGTAVEGGTIVSHDIGTGTPNTIENGGPISIQETSVTEYYGQIASIAFNDLVFDDIDDDPDTNDLLLEVSLEYLGVINVNTGEYQAGYYPPYVITDGTCAPYLLTYATDISDCQDLVPGCLDPLATNFTENATIDDGSCVYIDCTDIFSEQENSVFISEVTSDNDTLVCSQVEVPETNPTQFVNQYTPGNVGTMTIKVEDFSSAQLGAAGNEGNFTIAIMPLDIGGLNQIPALLLAYQNTAGAFEAGEIVYPGFAGAGGINAIFLPPDLDSAEIITGTVDGQSVSGVRYTTEVPANTLNTDAPGGLNAGQYLIFLIPFVDFSLFEGEGFGNLADCEEDFSYFADEQTYHLIGNTVTDTACPQPCDQFVSPELCPDAIPGCTDPAAVNYNPDATFNDGSCESCVDCEFCDLNPAHPDCNECDKGEQPVISAANRGFGARLRNCDGETIFCCCDETACNYDPACTDCDPTECEHTSCVDDETDDDEDDDIPVCPDPSNPECDNSGTGTCIDTDDCECVTANCNEDCVFEENNCITDEEDGDDPVEEFTTQTIICEPSISIPVTIDGVVTDNFVEAAVACTSSDTSKMLMRMKTGSHYDETDLLKLSLISYLFNRGTQQQLDCMFDCDNYVSKVKTTGKVKNFGQRMVPVDCTKKWVASGKKHFAASSNYSKGTVVRYIQIKSGKLVSSYFIARRDWHPGDEIPGTNPSKTSRIWEPCVNVKYQAGTNPENYMQTFIDFMVRHCQSCQVITNPTESSAPVKEITNNTSIGFQDEFGNNIIF